MNEIVINGIVYLPITADELQQMFGITIDAEVGLVYVGPESGTFTEEVIEVPESITEGTETVPVVGFAGGFMTLQTQNMSAAASVSEVILPSSIVVLMYGFYGFTNLQKVTCYAESVPKLSSEIGEPAGIDFEGTPETKELYTLSGSDYSTWENDTTWVSVNEIYDGFVEIVNGLKYKETGETTVALIGYDETFTATSLTIPSSITHEGNTYTVTVIKKNAFKNCTGLTSVTIPNGVTSIESYAFGYCSSLTSVTIPNSVTSINESAFSNIQGEVIDTTINNLNITVLENYTCEIDGLVTLLNVKDITFNYNNTSYNCSFGYIGKIGDYSNEYNTNLIGELNLDNVYYEGNKISVTYIGSCAFYYCGSLTSVTIPDSVTSIGERAFYKCSSLTSVTIPDSVTSIGNSAFDSCSVLTSVTIPDSVATIESCAFYGCSGLTSITIPEGVTTIEMWAFYNCTKLNTLNFNAINCEFDISSSKYQPFSKSPISVINIGKNVQKIPSYFAHSLTKLTSITIPNSVTSIGDSAFNSCSSLTSITIPDSVTELGGYVFQNCSKLKSVTIGNSVTELGHSAFYGCSLTSVTIPGSVTSLGNHVFRDCSSLTSIDIPDSVTSIGNDAFSGCTSFTTVIMLNPTALTISSSVFDNTPSTKVLFVPIDANGYTTSWGSTTWSAVNYTMVPTDGINYKLNDVNTIETYSSNNTNETLTIPSTVTYKDNTYTVNKVSRNSLANDNKVKTLTINSGITKIEASALSGCNNLETVNIPESVSEIDNHAFWMCKNLKTVNLPSTLTTLKPEMFVECSSLESITIPDGITVIPYRMFESCDNLHTVKLPNTITKIEWSAFKDCKNLTTINIPSGCNVDPTAFEGTNITV